MHWMWKASSVWLCGSDGTYFFHHIIGKRPCPESEVDGWWGIGKPRKVGPQQRLQINRLVYELKKQNSNKNFNYNDK